jgi:N-acetylmuramoyl-L-alanine amidase/GH25 family lysozyme M1 (1,4-beta-N-acetylmuramidase)
MPPSVVIDPGHGGATAEGGSSANNAIGPNGVLEKDVTLDLARRLAALLSERANVVLTRTGDENRSLTDRSGIARACNAAVFVSLHFNGWKDPSVDGSEAWVATHAAPASRAFARAALDRVVAVTHARDRGVKEQDFGVLLPERLGANTAAALLELAFLTNPEEATRLVRDDYKQALARAIATAVTDTLAGMSAGNGGALVESLAMPDQEAAIAIVEAFRAGTSLGAFSLGRSDVADRAIALINDPTLVDQASLNLCGPAALHRIWIARDPKAFARYVTSMYDAGEADLGSKHVTAGSDLRHQDYYGKAVPTMQKAGGVCPSAEWVAMSALRDYSNTFLDFEGMPDEDVSGITTPGELAAWMRATTLYADVSDEGNWFLTKGINHAEGLAPDANTDIAILINAHILTSAAASGHTKSDDFILKAFPNHFVVLRSRVTEPTPDEVEFDCWTWGHDAHVRVSKSVFSANYYGAVIARVTVPRHVTSSALESYGRIDGIHPSANDDELPSWADMKADGVLFELHKASEFVKDPRYDERYAAAQAARALFGAWHFMRATNPAVPGQAIGDILESQADVFVASVGRLLQGELPATLDFESKGVLEAPAVSGAAWRAPLERFLDKVETAFGRVPMIYTGKTLWDEHIDKPIHDNGADPQTFARFGDYPLWVIRIYWKTGNKNNFDDRLTKNIDADLPSPWKDWEIWQYDGSLSGEETTTRFFPHFTGIPAARKLDPDVSWGNIHRLRGLADVGTPAFYGDDVRVLAYADENGSITALQNLGFWQEASITDMSGALRAVGDVVACDVGNRAFLAFRSRADDHVIELAGDPGAPQGTPVSPTDVTGAAIAVGDPVYVVSGENRALVYWGFDDHLYVAVNISGTWQPTLDVNNGAGINDIATGNAALFVSDGDLHIAGRMGRGGNLIVATLRGAFQPGSQWDRAPVDITARAGAPAATYRPTTYVGADGGTRIVYRALRGHLHQIDNMYQDSDLSQTVGAPTCAGNPAAFVLDGLSHIVYRRPDGLLHEIAADGAGGWTQRALPCAEAAADPTVSVGTDHGQPAAFVGFRGRDGGFHQAVLQAGAWSCQPIGPTSSN